MLKILKTILSRYKGEDTKIVTGMVTSDLSF